MDWGVININSIAGRPRDRLNHKTTGAGDGRQVNGRACSTLSPWPWPLMRGSALRARVCAYARIIIIILLRLFVHFVFWGTR